MTGVLVKKRDVRQKENTILLGYVLKVNMYNPPSPLPCLLSEQEMIHERTRVFARRMSCKRTDTMRRHTSGAGDMGCITSEFSCERHPDTATTRQIAVELLIATGRSSAVPSTEITPTNSNDKAWSVLVLVVVSSQQ